MKHTRSYSEDETPQVGDVIQLFEGAFGAGVITRITPNPLKYGDTWAVVERTHASVSEHGHQVQIGLERVEVPLHRIKSEMPVFVTGPSGRIDNRKR